MRKFNLICFLFCLVNYSFGQDTTRKQNVFGKYRSWAEFSAAHHNPIFVIDNNMIADTLVTKVLKNLDAASVLEINILKDSLPATVYAQQPLREVVLVVTKAYAIAQYQKKLGTLSRKYKHYLLSHQNDDNDILYVISNGKNSVNGSSAELLSDLYEIQSKKVKRLRFVEGENTIMRFSHFAVIITKH